jgi:ATPase subunit of ABC transporter with duplicated ATPase domains
VFEAISDGQEFIQLGNAKVNARSYVTRFGFTGTDQSRSVGTLSGGERNRVHLARMLKSGGNVLAARRADERPRRERHAALEEAMENFAGCAVVISHDRWFLDRVATHILAFEGDSQVVFHEGNYQSYEADRKKRLGIDADQPHRIKYRKLTKA